MRTIGNDNVQNYDDPASISDCDGLLAIKSATVYFT